ncbi:gamma-butyrobetaine dioxygenase [Pedobacter steynii]|uniref:Gamma-butyrobetaine dioxygenase n=1 Tax=Pedobacter steynii TaxID=430522 RepID=A0A1G9NNB1_9SPHI|nr:TauD/TfdA family dioxygenase [Pedobacter steynii]NQX39255.1 TauD/TfdA family dioxygenase [Pedobacter steynii]SDL87495.1 gamma-butyrobetaine dioxygenase [Pedobacter steynii]
MEQNENIMNTQVLIEKVTEAEYALLVHWENGEISAYPFLYLRDNCPSPSTLHSNGQKLIETSAINPAIRPKSLQLNPQQEVLIEWDTEVHVSVFSADWLFNHRLSKTAIAARREGKKASEPVVLWDETLNDQYPVGDYTEIAVHEEALCAWLEQVRKYGFAVLRNVPAEPGMVCKVVELFGYIRETNYGKLFDVRTTLNPSNLAFTSLGLSAHTDNPYRNPTPTLQLLHCLQSSAVGGNSVLVDGFKVIADLKLQHPEMFRLLSTTPVTFRFVNQEEEIERTETIIGLDVFDEVNAIRFNNRSIQAFELEEDQMSAFYAAYQQLAKMIDDEHYFVQFKMEASDLFIVDNERVMHGRSAYDGAAGERFLQGAYADRDGLLSKLRVLKRKEVTQQA